CSSDLAPPAVVGPQDARQDRVIAGDVGHDPLHLQRVLVHGQRLEPHIRGRHFAPVVDQHLQQVPARVAEMLAVPVQRELAPPAFQPGADVASERVYLRHRTSSHCVCGPNRAIKAASASACPSPFFSSAALRGHSWIARDLAASLSVPTSPALRFHVTGATFVTGIIWPTTTPSPPPAAWPNVNVLATPCPGIEPTCSM